VSAAAIAAASLPPRAALTYCTAVLLLARRWADQAKYFFAPLLRNLDAGGRAFVQKVLEKGTVQFYKRDRAGTGGTDDNEQVSA
jgi:hypothetical protein